MFSVSGKEVMSNFGHHLSRTSRKNGYFFCTINNFRRFQIISRRTHCTKNKLRKKENNLYNEQLHVHMYMA